MDQREKELLQSQLNNEKAVLRQIKKDYKGSLYEIDKKIKDFQVDIQAKQEALNLIQDESQRALLQSEIQSKIYQKQYQDALKQQINAILDNMNSKQYDTIKGYIEGCYEEGFIGTMYDLHGQNIPLVMPIDQTQVIKAVVNDTKLSKPLYESLGYQVGILKKQINREISRGIATASSYADIARNVEKRTGVTMGRAYLIARTEGHRVQNQAAFDAQNKAKSKGADIVKQWNATLDARTRDTHAELDGQIRELDDPFEVAGHKAMYPGGFGIASEDCNCRCALSQRARWALDEEELQILKDRAQYYDLDKNDGFKDFKKKYLNYTDHMIEMDDFCNKYKISDNERYAINQYLSSESYKINDALRRGVKLTAEQKKFIDTFNKALDKFPTYTGDLTRSLQFVNKDAQDEFLKDYKKGSPISYKEFLSTTKGKDLYNPNDKVQIYIKDSKQGKDFSVFNPKEQEVLYKTNSKFEVAEIEEVKGTTWIMLKEK